MRAARCEQYGGPGNVVVRDIPSPEVTPGHVLVDVAAGAVQEIVFPLPAARRARWLLAGILVGAALGWFSAWAVRAPAWAPAPSAPPR